MLISEEFQLKTGRPLSKLKISDDKKAKKFDVYDHDDLNYDLNHIPEEKEDKSITTDSTVVVVKCGDLIFSSVTGKCAIVSADNDGKILTQNFIRIRTNGKYDIGFLGYLLNESQDIKKQYNQILQTSLVKRYDEKSVKSLKIPSLDFKKQKLISNLYFKELKKYSLEIKKINDEKKLILNSINLKNLN